MRVQFVSLARSRRSQMLSAVWKYRYVYETNSCFCYGSHSLLHGHAYCMILLLLSNFSSNETSINKADSNSGEWDLPLSVVVFWDYCSQCVDRGRWQMKVSHKQTIGVWGVFFHWVETANKQWWKHKMKNRGLADSRHTFWVIKLWLI